MTGREIYIKNREVGTMHWMQRKIKREQSRTLPGCQLQDQVTGTTLHVRDYSKKTQRSGRKGGTI